MRGWGNLFRHIGAHDRPDHRGGEEHRADDHQHYRHPASVAGEDRMRLGVLGQSNRSRCNRDNRHQVFHSRSSGILPATSDGSSESTTQFALARSSASAGYEVVTASTGNPSRRTDSMTIGASSMINTSRSEE